MAAFILVILFETATSWKAGREVSSGAPAEPLAPLVSYPPDFGTALTDADRALATAQAQAAAVGGWLAEERLAGAHLQRARLTGSVEDYAAAEQALARSTALAPPGAGPHLLHAAFHLSVHRLDEAEVQLDQLAMYAVPPAAHERAEMEAMRGDIAFYRGRYEEALRRYDLADRFSPGSTAFRRATHHSAKGDIRSALRALDEAERESGQRTIMFAARTELQRGVFALEEGRVDQAGRHFARADALFPGDWRIEEHVAEALALSGEVQQANRLYRDIVARTADPGFMDQLARLARSRNDQPEAQNWTRRAAEIWKHRLRLFPEAYAAEAADHCLASENFTCALRLAQLNYRARPYGEAAVLLAEALAASGRRQEARSILADLHQSGWQSSRTRRLSTRLGMAQENPAPASLAQARSGIGRGA